MSDTASLVQELENLYNQFTQALVALGVAQSELNELVNSISVNENRVSYLQAQNVAADNIISEQQSLKTQISAELGQLSNSLSSQSAMRDGCQASVNTAQESTDSLRGRIEALKAQIQSEMNDDFPTSG